MCYFNELIFISAHKHRHIELHIIISDFPSTHSNSWYNTMMVNHLDIYPFHEYSTGTVMNVYLRNTRMAFTKIAAIADLQTSRLTNEQWLELSANSAPSDTSTIDIVYHHANFTNSSNLLQHYSQ